MIGSGKIDGVLIGSAEWEAAWRESMARDKREAAEKKAAQIAASNPQGVQIGDAVIGDRKGRHSKKGVRATVVSFRDVEESNRKTRLVEWVRYAVILWEDGLSSNTWSGGYGCVPCKSLRKI